MKIHIKNAGNISQNKRTDLYIEDGVFTHLCKERRIAL
jgi:hypothetical protein